MKLLTRSFLASVARDRWYAQYTSLVGWRETQMARPASETYALLTGVTDPDEVDRIIGNSGWTRSFCEECHAYKETAVVFSAGHDCSTICSDCLSAAAALLPKSS